MKKRAKKSKISVELPVELSHPISVQCAQLGIPRREMAEFCLILGTHVVRSAFDGPAEAMIWIDTMRRDDAVASHAVEVMAAAVAKTVINPPTVKGYPDPDAELQ